MRRRCTAALIAFVMVLFCLQWGATSGSAEAAPVKMGGTVTTILQNLVFADVDPAFGSEPLWEAQFMDAIFGDLFTALPNGKVGLGFAASDTLSNNNKTFTFTLKHGIDFSDGTPLNAAAVVFNIKRDLANACICASDFQYVKTVTATAPYTVQIQMSQPDSVIAQAFLGDTPDWIASPTAIKKMGNTAFGEHPVGAGPFEVSQIVPNSKVVLTKNPHYYIKGEPYLDGLTFETQTVDQSAYAALQSGSAQVLSGILTPSIITQSESQFHTILVPGPLVENLEMNSFAKPLNNVLAREAVSYAINPATILAINSPGLGQVAEGVQGPGGQYYTKTVSGYHGYDLAKAQALVKQLGGLSFTLTGTTNATSITLLTSLQSQLAKANIHVKLATEQLPLEMKQLGEGTGWQAVTSETGGIDPDVGSLNLYSRFEAKGQYTCCKSTTLDQMVTKTYDLANGPTRANEFNKIFSWIDSQSYIVPLYAPPEDIIAAKNLDGLNDLVANPNGSVAISIPWATVHYAS
jgi:peptide/nickel transport system substrate-binding protein